MFRNLLLTVPILIAMPGIASAFAPYGSPGYYNYWGYQPPIYMPPPSGINVYHYHYNGYIAQQYYVHRHYR